MFLSSLNLWLSSDLIVPTTHNSVSGPVDSTHPKVVWYLYIYVRLEMDMKYWLLGARSPVRNRAVASTTANCVFLYKGRAFDLRYRCEVCYCWPVLLVGSILLIAPALKQSVKRGVRPCSRVTRSWPNFCHGSATPCTYARGPSSGTTERRPPRFICPATDATTITFCCCRLN